MHAVIHLIGPSLGVIAAVHVVLQEARIQGVQLLVASGAEPAIVGPAVSGAPASTG